MILRRMVLRQGRQLSSTITKAWSRSFASEVDRLESSLDNSLKETHSIEAQIQTLTPKSISRVYNVSHSTRNPVPDEMVLKYRSFQHAEHHTAHFGSNVTPGYRPSDLVNSPNPPSEITLELLMASQAHLGHSTSLWNPMNSRYIYGIRQGIHIISLDVTAQHLRRACRIVSAVTERGGLVLFVGSRPGQDRCVIRAAQESYGCHLFDKWIPGSITNGEQILRTCTVKPVDEFDRDIPGFTEEMDEQPVLKPDLVVCLNPLENWVLLHECGLHHIPTIGIIDTDADPTWVTYPIPANDDSLRCVEMICGALGRAGGKDGKGGKSWLFKVK